MRYCNQCGNLVTCKNADLDIVGFLCNEERFYVKRRLSTWCIKDCLAGYLKLDIIDGKAVKHDKCNKED